MVTDEENYYLKNLLDSQQWFKVAGGLVADAKELVTKVNEFWDAANAAIETAKKSAGKDLRSLPSDRVLGTYYMLMAFAIENMLKGIIIKRDFVKLEREARAKKKIPSAINKHNLISLATEAHITINTVEEELLLRLKDNLIWRGRYPVPLTENGLNSKPLNNGDFASQAHYSKGDVDTIDALINKLQQAA